MTGLVLPALVIFFTAFGVEARDDAGQERLVSEFVQCLIQGCDFQKVEHLFLSMDDFSELVRVLKNADIPERERKQLEGRRNLEKQKQEMRRKIKRRIRQPWNKITASIKERDVNLKYNDYHSKAVVRNGITIYRVAIRFLVERRGVEHKVEKTIKVMNLGGKLKIVQLFHRI